MNTPTGTRTVRVGAAHPVDITVDDRDRTRPFLLLHGGGGVATMTGFAGLLAERAHARVLLPTHPGFAGTPRDPRLADVADLARAYVGMLDELDLVDVTVLGNSFGGWLAAEIALAASPRVGAVLIVDGIGIEVDGHPMTDVSGMSPAEIRTYSFHDPSRTPAPADGGGPSPDVRALIGYTGPTMSDPTLAGRLAGLTTPTHVLWGASDRIVDPAYGRAYADAIPGATFTVLPGTGHLPQLETPETVLDKVLSIVRR
ncbi:alpha/beta fold hydrolase [Actinocatenispora rupis]|uniref:Alpha/beta hydrolase n=1 Tax=Actinocatenispora rupis TaxID=519421 RepID=A0A8J3J2P9_9ACTN|nr:alpha/beta hydrolase [Actinocatenispora rupis]GID10892.1 alpha/beta hydrolase [Actinocatenispora rupis]